MMSDFACSNTMLRHYEKPSPIYLAHAGRKGMRWGIQNGPPYPIDEKSGSTAHYDSGKMSLRLESFEPIRLPKAEYAHVMSEIATHISDEQRLKQVFMKAIGNYIYTVVNDFNGTSQIIGKEEIMDDYYDINE